MTRPASDSAPEQGERRERRKGAGPATPLDVELEDLPPAARWREWMMRAEAVIFAGAEPVGRADIARVVGAQCNIDLLIADIREELKARPYDIAEVAGGWQHRTRRSYATAIRASAAPLPAIVDLGSRDAATLMAIAYFQPVTRAELSRIFGREISRDGIAALRQAGYITSGPRSPTPGAPYSYVTTPRFLAAFGFSTLRDLPDIEALEDAGLLNRVEMSGAGNAAVQPPGGDQDEGE